MSSRRLDGDNRVTLIGILQVLCLEQTVDDHASGANTRISRRIPIARGPAFALRAIVTEAPIMPVTTTLLRTRFDEAPRWIHRSDAAPTSAVDTEWMQ